MQVARWANLEFFYRNSFFGIPIVVAPLLLQSRSAPITVVSLLLLL
jgi:hypothetical protein